MSPLPWCRLLRIIIMLPQEAMKSDSIMHVCLLHFVLEIDGVEWR